MNTAENNKIIAKFMGADISADKPEYFLHYSTSWDWLMGVVEKIYSLELEIELVLIVRDALADASIICTYDACLDFINWHNEQKNV